MKKICFITTVPTTIESFVLKTAIYIHRHTDWEIHFICSEDEAFRYNLPEYLHYHSVHMERGISVTGVKAMFRMFRIFKQEHFDLVQYSTPNASLYASVAAKLAGIPVRLYCQWGMAYVGFSGLKRGIFKTIEKIVCWLSTWIEPDSNSNLKFAHEEKLYPMSKGSVIWHGSACGVDLRKFDYTHRNEYRENIRKQYGIPENAFVFGFVGRITRDKGVNELFETVKRLLDKNEKIYLMMVGRDESDETVNQGLYEWSKNNNNVIYTGYSDIVEQMLSAMDCYVLPSYREGFGMGVVEAEAMGVPVIVTDIPGPIDGMQKDVTGIVVPPKDVDALCTAMENLLNSPEQCKKYGENGVLFAAQNFEQKELFKRILEDRKQLLQL